MHERKSTNKGGLIGTGMVGASFAYSLMQHGLANELVLIDMDTARAEGEAMDLNHGLPFVGPMRISAGDYPDLADADVVVICAGANQRPGQTRLDLLKKNAGVFRLRDRRRAAHGRRGDLARPAHGADGRQPADGAVRRDGYGDQHADDRRAARDRAGAQPAAEHTRARGVPEFGTDVEESADRGGLTQDLNSWFEWSEL
jgi:hypothetical protein